MSNSSNTKNRPEVKFVESEAPKIHPALSGAGEYDEQSQIFVPRARVLQCEQMKKQMEGDADDLEQAVKEYQATLTNEYDRAFNLRNNTWADVFRQMEKAEEADNERYDKGIMRAWRKFRDNVTEKMDDIDPWLNLIPTDYGLCVVRAGIVLGLRAVRRNAEDHKMVREAIVQIVQTVADARPRSNVFGRNPSLDKAVRDLYVAVLSAVSFIIRYLRYRSERSRGSRMGDKIRSPWKQNDTKSPGIKEIENAVEKVRASARQFEQSYGILKDQLQRDFYELELDTRGHVLQIEDYARSSNKYFNGFEERLENLEKLGREAVEEFRRKNYLLEKANVEVQTQNALLRLLEAQRAARDQGYIGGRNELLAPGGHAFVRPTTPTPVRPPFLVTVDELMQVLRVPLRMANDDLQDVIMSKSWLKQGAAAQTLLSYTNFQDWLVGSGSRVLLVDGIDGDNHYGTVSTMSVLAVDIMASLVKANRQGQVAVVHFFCGLHSRPTEGPKMMTRSLIVQIMVILQRYRCLNLDFISSQEFVADLQDQRFDALLYTLQQLCHQLPQYLTVYCFIDGIDFYESRLFPFYDDMVAFMRGMTRNLLASGTAGPGLVDYYPGNGPRFQLKLLYTTAAGTLFEEFVTNRIALSESDVDGNFPSDGVLEDAL